MYNKDMSIPALIDTYGPILSDRKREIIESYYFEDLSLSEISENTGISRQGVRDSIKSSEKELIDMEAKLSFKKRIDSYNFLNDEIVAELEELASTLPSSDSVIIKGIIEKLKQNNI